MSPSKRSNSFAMGASAGEPHQPVSPKMLMNVEALPGGGTTGGVNGVSPAGSGDGIGVGKGVAAIGTVSTAVCGAVGEPPPHWLIAIALANKRAIPSSGRRRKGIYKLWQV